MRLKRRWTQRELGRRTGLSRLIIGRIERGKGSLDVERLERISIAFDVPLAIGFDRDPHEQPTDAGHLAIQEIVLRLAPPAYGRGFELPTRPNDPWRSADVGLWADRWRTAVDAECWNTFGDLGAATRSSMRKVVELEALALARWGPGARAALVWVVRETVRNRDLVGRYEATLSAFFTGSSRHWVDALTNGAEPPAKPGLVWCDVATGRLREWRRQGGAPARNRSAGARSSGS